MAYATGPIEMPGNDLANDAPHEELYRVGLIYSTGIGAAEDIVAAHKWFNLAAARGNEDAKQARQDMADQMTTEEIALAQKAAREWLNLMN